MTTNADAIAIRVRMKEVRSDIEYLEAMWYKMPYGSPEAIYVQNQLGELYSELHQLAQGLPIPMPA